MAENGPTPSQERQLKKTEIRPWTKPDNRVQSRMTATRLREASRRPYNAGWSSPVAREAHNLEVAGSNPVPAICRKSRRIQYLGYLPMVGSAACFRRAKTVHTVLGTPMTGLHYAKARFCPT